MSNNLAPDVIDRLLDRLGNDDAFRSLFQSDPREALKQVGHVTAPANIGVAGQDPVVCCQSATLASKEQIRSSRDLFQKRMQSFNPQNFFES